MKLVDPANRERSLNAMGRAYRRTRSSTSVGNAFYIGQFLDDATNLDYLNARYYDPVRGQFLSQDPTFLSMGDPNAMTRLTRMEQMQFLMDPQLSHSYSYGRGNPVRYSDPAGTFIQIPALLWFAGGALIRYGATAMTAYDVAHYADTKLNPNYYPEPQKAQAGTEAAYSGITQVIGEFGTKKQQRVLDLLGFVSKGLEYMFGARGDEQSSNMPRVNLGGTGRAQSNIPNNNVGAGTTRPQAPQSSSFATAGIGYNAYSGSGSSGVSSNAQLITGLQNLVASLTRLVATLTAMQK
jgi:RHS repeat-associated protein